MEEKLLVNRYYKRLNVPSRRKGIEQRRDQGLWGGAYVRCLADLASGVCSPTRMRVTYALGDKYNEQDRQDKSDHPELTMSRLGLPNHLES